MGLITGQMETSMIVCASGKMVYLGNDITRR